MSTKKQLPALLSERGITGISTVSAKRFAKMQTPIRDSATARGMAVRLTRKGWISVIQNPKSMDEMPDYEITPAGQKAQEAIWEAMMELEPKRKNGSVPSA